MRVVVGDEVLRVAFRYDPPLSTPAGLPKVEVRDRNGIPHPVVPRGPGQKTSCTIAVKGKDGKYQEVSLGTVTVFHKDKFDREQGRRAALRLAVQPLTREARAKVWLAYWKETNQIV